MDGLRGALKEYNWIHAYPNAAAEVIALWFGIWTLRRPATSSPWKVRMRTVPQPRY